MDKHITVTSQDQNPSDFISNSFQNLNLEGEYEIALKTIYYAPLFNITEKENSYMLYDATTQMKYSLKIEAGFYENEADVLGTIYNGLVDFLSSSLFVNEIEEGVPLTSQPIQPIYHHSDTRVFLKFPKEVAKRLYFWVGPGIPLPRYLGYFFPEQTGVTELSCPGDLYANSITPGFVYCSCVENSIFNEHQSRLLAVVPFESKSNYSMYTFENPTYVPLAKQSLLDVLFTICDKDGNPIQTEYMEEDTIEFPTILSLHLRQKV